MKAIRIYEYGGPEVMRLEDLQLAAPGPNQVLVKIEVAGVNFADIYSRNGLWQPALPSTMGHEGAGVVEAAGSSVMEVSVGNRVAWTGVSGSYATHCLVSEERLVVLPDKLSFNEGAAIMTQGLTAHYLAHSICSINVGDVCLIHAAAGGTGRLLCQMLKMLGAQVIGTVSNEFKAGIASDAGVDDIIIYTKQDFEEEIKRLTNGNGVRVVFDSVGKDTFEKSLKCLAARGHLILYGQSSGMAPLVNPEALREKSLSLTRPYLMHYIAVREELLRRASTVFDWLEKGKLRLRIDRVYSLENVAAAHELLESRQSAGKILLIP